MWRIKGVRLAGSDVLLGQELRLAGAAAGEMAYSVSSSPILRTGGVREWLLAMFNPHSKYRRHVKLPTKEVLIPFYVLRMRGWVKV